MAAFRGDTEVRLVLNPPDLGHLDIRIASGDGGLRVTLEASQSGTRDLIDRSLVQLQQALESRDLRLERIEVRSADGGRAGMDGSGDQPHGHGNGANGGDGQPEWSPIAALNAVSSADSGALSGLSAQATSLGASQTTAAGEGRLDVMA
jgi:flagellar hook-length control protein FliK